jgi:peptide deformylase
VLDIVTYGNEILAQKAEPVKEFTPELAAFVEELYDTMVKGHGVGLAANQVGRLLRIFVTGVDGDKQRVFINPEIIATSPEESDYEEGCLSLPGLYTHVTRPAAVKIQAWNEKGRPFTFEADGFLARVILHENDHLNGVLFIDRLSAPRRERALSQYLRRTRM